MKKLGILVLALAVIAFCFTGCTIKSQLMGTKWHVLEYETAESGWQDATTDGNVYFSFARDGVFYYQDNDGTDQGTWSADGSQLTASNGGETMIATVKITGKKMTLSELASRATSEKITAYKLEKVGSL